MREIAPKHCRLITINRSDSFRAPSLEPFRTSITHRIDEDIIPTTRRSIIPRIITSKSHPDLLWIAIMRELHGEDPRSLFAILDLQHLPTSELSEETLLIISSSLFLFFPPSAFNCLSCFQLRIVTRFRDAYVRQSTESWRCSEMQEDATNCSRGKRTQWTPYWKEM